LAIHETAFSEQLRQQSALLELFGKSQVSIRLRVNEQSQQSIRQFMTEVENLDR